MKIHYYQSRQCLRRLRQLQHCLNQCTMTMFVTSLILQRFDYCNSVLVGLAASSTKPFQPRSPAHESSRQCYNSYMDIGYQFITGYSTKTATLTHHIYNRSASAYLCDLNSVSSTCTRSLISTSSEAPDAGRYRAFSVAGMKQSATN